MFKVVMKVNGMMSKECEAEVNSAICSAADVLRLVVSCRTASAEFISYEKPNIDAICDSVAECGYRVWDTRVEPYV